MLVAQSSLTLQFQGLYPPGTSVHGIDSPGKNTGVGSHPLLQGIFQTQGLTQVSCSDRQILYHLSQQGNLSCYCSVAKSCLFDPMDCSTPGLPVMKGKPYVTVHAFEHRECAFLKCTLRYVIEISPKIHGY